MTPEQREAFRWDTAARIMAGLAANPSRDCFSHEADVEYAVYATDALIAHLEASEQAQADIHGAMARALDVGPNDEIQELQARYVSVMRAKSAPNAD